MSLDRFLRDIYKEEQTKVASVQLEDQMMELSKEALLKIALGGAEEPRTLSKKDALRLAEISESKPIELGAGKGEGIGALIGKRQYRKRAISGGRGLGASRLTAADTEKTAKDDRDYPVRPGWLTGQKAIRRSMYGDKGLSDRLLSGPPLSLLQSRHQKGTRAALIGSGLGAGVGAAGGALIGRDVGSAGLGAAFGGALGAHAGIVQGTSKADKEYLKERGIKLRRGGFGAPRLTEEAAKRYLKENEPRAVVKKTASMQFADELARNLAHAHSEIAKTSGEKIKTDEFTSPEAKQKAKVMSGALKTTKGAPPEVRKAAVRMAGKRLGQIR